MAWSAVALGGLDGTAGSWAQETDSGEPDTGAEVVALNNTPPSFERVPAYFEYSATDSAASSGTAMLELREWQLSPRGEWVDHWRGGWLDEFISDHRNLYSRENLGPTLLVLSSHALLANSDIDQEFADWYQSSVRSEETDEVSRHFKMFGEHWQAMGVYGGVSVVGRALDWDPRITTWSDRCWRSCILGIAPVYFSQRMIGASRPNDNPASSAWNFWADENGSSGHAYVGAVPFLVAARMSQRPAMKTTFLVASTWTGWSRLNDDHHYLSQVILGWWLAYLATDAVQRTDEGTSWELQPQWIDNTPGLGIEWRF